MKLILLAFIIFFVLVSSCTVVNNMYVNDPVPAGKGNLKGYIGLGSGITPRIDSIADNGTVYRQNRYKLAPNLCLGVQAGLGKQTDLRVALNLPYIIAGTGIRAGIQHSFFQKENPFNIALLTDAGIVFSKDSLFGKSLENPMKNTINGDFALPLSYSFGPESRIILTPRASFNAIYIRDNINRSKTKAYTPFIPSITLGVKLHRIYFEAGIHSVNQQLFPNFGMAYIISVNK